MSNPKIDYVTNKLAELSKTELDRVCDYIDFLEYKRKPIDIENPQTNEEIEIVRKIYVKEGKPTPSGLAKGEFVVPDDFNDPLPNEILELFEG